jgi:hypothetical protein
MKSKSHYQHKRLLIHICLAITFIIFFNSCKKQDLTNNRNAVEEKAKPYLPNYGEITNNDLKQIAYTIFNTSKKGLGQELVRKIGTPIWEKSIEKGNQQKQWFIPFTKDKQSVLAVMIFEKINGKYRYQSIHSNDKALSSENKILLGYINMLVFGQQMDKSIGVGKDNKIPLVISLPAENVQSRWISYETCIASNIHCNCPSSYDQCDMCEQCMGTWCYTNWIWTWDELDEVDPIDPGGGGGGGGNSSFIGFLSYNLNLTQNRISFLENNPTLQDELYHYLIMGNNINDNEVKQICREHIDKMMDDQSYLQFVVDHQNSGATNTVWWIDDNWLDDPSNFNLDITNEGTQYDKLTAAEKALVSAYPVQAYVIKQNMQPAFAMSTTKMGSAGGLNDKKDGFRHAFFQAINARDVPGRWLPTAISGTSIVILFANAHESEVPA